MSRLEGMLASKDFLVADGGMGSSLYDLGLAIGDAPELWLTRHPERISAVHRAFVDAGADLILTNTFGANRYRLALIGEAACVADLNRRGAEIARSAAEDPGREVLVAGAVGPLGVRPVEADAVDVFAEQMAALKAGGVDLIWVETMMTIAELVAAAAAAARTQLPFVVTASFGSDGLLDGATPEAVARVLMELSPRPTAIGCNCGVGPKALVAAVTRMRAASPAAVLVAKANAGLPRLVNGRAQYATTNDDIKAYARNSRAAGARIIGGCCGVTPAHVALIRRTLDGAVGSIA